MDGDGDGKRDVWNSSAERPGLGRQPDGQGRLAARRGLGARGAAAEPKFDYGLAEGPRSHPARLAKWAKRSGARRADGLPFVDIDKETPCQLILPAGATGPAFLVLPNHFVIRRYNNSTAYALTVGLLADRVAGMGPLTVAWPPEPPLSTDDRAGAQKALLALGFDPGAADGVIGVNTRVALRNWQKARSLPADGHLTQALSQQLAQAQAGSLLGPKPPPDTPPTARQT